MGVRLGKGLLTLLLVLGLLAPGARIFGQESGHMVETPAANSVPLIDETLTEDACQVTLISGDVVTVVTGADGDMRFAVSPADSEDAGQPFYVLREPGSTYVIPGGVDLQKLDRELFNIEYLMVEGYHQQPTLPLLVTYSPVLAEPRVEVLTGVIGRLGRETRLYPDVCTLSTRVSYSDISASYESLVSRPEVQKIWLDKKVYVRLSDSVPLIGAEWWWTSTGNTGEGISIAILDTGIDASHPAFEDRVMVEANFTNDPTADDWHGHGTHCAGIAAGSAAGSDYQGVAPGADLWNVKVINQHGWGFLSWIIDGLDFASLGPDGLPATGDEADIISMSLGGWPTDGTDPLSSAVNLAVERGVIVVTAAGNDGPSPLTITTPGAAEKAITVGATDKLDTVAWFSSRGPTLDWRVKPDIVAPGVGIVSAVPWGYESWSGTSMAAPHVAGAAALLLEQHGGEATPQFIKDALIYTARDLGHSIYEQGGGRLDLDWELWPSIGVTPANLSLGLATEATLGGNLTFFTPELAPQEVTLAAVLVDAMTGEDYSRAVTLEPASFAIPGGGQVTVAVDVDLSSMPHSVFEGKVLANVEGEARTVHAVIGFARLLEVTVHKLDINGQPARWHPLWVLRESPYEGIMHDWVEFDGSGTFTFRAPVGTYHFFSPNWSREEEEVTIWTIAENVEVSGNTTVVLDERDTFVVDLDPQKPGQILADQSSSLFWEQNGWGSWWRYAPDSLTRVSPISLFDASFTYSYFAEAEFVPDDPWLVNTDQWHSLRYSVTELYEDITFIVDYDDLVQRRTMYCVALEDEMAEWAQWSWDNIGRWAIGVAYRMNAPQTRTDWLSPAPVRYGQMYAKVRPGGEWHFETYETVYPPGEHEWRIGAHPLTPGIETWIRDNWLEIGGMIARDAAGSDFGNLRERSSGTITVTRDGTEVLHEDIWDSFWTGVEFEGTPHFVVEIEGWRPLALSSTTRTVLDFVADPAYDYRPPQLLAFEVPGLDIFGARPNGEVTFMVRVMDESPLYDVSLAYSVDDGETWSDAGAPVLEAGWLVFSLADVEDAFVDVALRAQDLRGNIIHHSIKRAFRVGPWIAISTTELPAAPAGAAYEAPLKAIGGNLPYTWDIVEGSLPPGLTLAGDTGVVSGVSTMVGDFDFTVGVRDEGDLSATRELSITVFAWTGFIADPVGDQFEGYGPDIVGVDLHLDDSAIRFRVKTAEPIDPYDTVNYMFLDLDLDVSTGYVSPHPELPTNDIGADAVAVIFPGHYGMMETALSRLIAGSGGERRLASEQAQAPAAGLLGELWLWDSHYEGFVYAGDLAVFCDTGHFWFAVWLDILDDDGIMAAVNVIGDSWSLTDVAPNQGHGVTVPPANVVRTLPYAVMPGQEFEVSVAFTAPADDFNAIGLSDIAPAGWAVAVDTAWALPVGAVAHTPSHDQAAYVWFGPYYAGQTFTVRYRVQVPPGAAPGLYSFPGATLTYYIAGDGSYVEPITGDREVEIAVARIEGRMGEVNCEILPGVAVDLYEGDIIIATGVTDADGWYELAVPAFGEYTLVAGKTGLRDKEQTVSVTGSATYTIDFLADNGLIPESPCMSYVLACLNLWQFGAPPCRLTMSGVLEVTNAWQFPIRNVNS